jgi:PAS domain S-box-containing protein
LHDITDRKVAEDALYKSEMILRTFIDNIPFDIWARDIHTVGILENKKMVEHFGSIIGKKTAEIDRSQDEIELYNSINEKAFKGDIVDDEYELLEHGLPKYYRQIVFPIYDRTKVTGIASINIDITERKQFEKALDESQEQLKKFAAHLQSVREEERLLLAREIHDELGQILIAMKIDMGLLRQYVMKNIVDDAFNQTVEKFNGLLSLVDNTIQTARRIMTDLRPEVLDLLGFVDTVKQYAAKFEERHKIKCDFHATHFPVTINSDQSVALFRIVQEALNNIAKHALATKISITIDIVQNNYVVQIIDNGIGFDMNKKSRSDSYGLIGMKERVFLLGATLDIQSEIGKGTTIRVEVPKQDEPV